MNPNKGKYAFASIFDNDILFSYKLADENASFVYE